MRTDEPGTGRPTLPISTCVGVLTGGAAGGLRQAVALEDQQAGAVEEVPEPLTERRAAGQRVPQPSTERAPQLAVDEPAVQGVLGLEAPARAAVGRLLRVLDGHRGRPLEDALLGALRRAGLRHAEDLLEHAGHGDDERRLELLHLRHQPGEAAGVGDVDALRHARHLHDTGQDVGEGQEGQRRALVVEHVAERGHGLAGVPDQVAVGEGAALGATRRARRVDEGAEVVVGDGGDALVDLLLRDPAAEPDQLGDGAVVDDEHVLGVRQPLGHRVVDLALVLRAADHGDGAAVADDPLDLVGGRGLVDGDRGAAGGPDGVVEVGELDAGRHEQAHPGARFDAEADQPGRQLPDLGDELGRRDVDEAVTGPVGQGGSVWVVLAVGEERGDDVVVRRDRDLTRRRELLHADVLPGARVARQRSQAGSAAFSSSRDALFMQYRWPVGRGPSGNRWPRWEPQRRQRTSVRIMPWLRSSMSSTAWASTTS